MVALGDILEFTLAQLAKQGRCRVAIVGVDAWLHTGGINQALVGFGARYDGTQWQARIENRSHCAFGDVRNSDKHGFPRLGITERHDPDIDIGDPGRIESNDRRDQVLPVPVRRVVVAQAILEEDEIPLVPGFVAAR